MKKTTMWIRDYKARGLVVYEFTLPADLAGMFGTPYQGYIDVPAVVRAFSSDVPEEALSLMERGQYPVPDVA